jgi:hypothetical protein
MAGGRCAFHLPPQWGLPEALKKVTLIVSFSSFPDEIGQAAQLVLPTRTFLESWGDYTPWTGVRGLLQPVMGPIFDTPHIGDILLSLGRGLKGKRALPRERFLRGGIWFLGPSPQRNLFADNHGVGRAGSASARGRLGPGHDITKEASDLVIPSAKPLAIMDAFELSRLSIRTVHQNPCFAFLYNATAVSVAAAGLLNPLIAVLAMCMSSLTVIGNALRIAGK